MASFTPKSPSKYSATQQANFAKNSDPAKGISLVIPRVFNNIGELRIKQHIIEANLGFVERVDVVPVAEGKYKRAFVHFAAGKWNMRDATARAALTALQAGESIKLEYESPWYWLVSISGEARPDEAPKPRERKTKVVIEPGNGRSSYEMRKNRRYDEWRSMPYKEKSQYDEFEKIKALSRQAGESKQNNTEKFKRANAAENRANAAENRLKRAKAAENRLKRANAAENRLNKTTKKGGRRKKRKTRRKKKSKKKCRKKRKKSRKTKSNKR